MKLIEFDEILKNTRKRTFNDASSKSKAQTSSKRVVRSWAISNEMDLQYIRETILANVNSDKPIYRFIRKSPPFQEGTIIPLRRSITIEGFSAFLKNNWLRGISIDAFVHTAQLQYTELDMIIME